MGNLPSNAMRLNPAQNSTPPAVDMTDAQHALLDEVARQATLSDQHDDRKRLRDAYPQLMSAIFQTDNGHYTGYAREMKDEERQAIIEKFWPMDRTIAEIKDGRLVEGNAQVMTFDFNGEGFERGPALDKSQIRIMACTSQDETFEGEPYEEDGETFTTEKHDYTGTHFLVLSRRVALKITHNYGEYTDEDDDAMMSAVVFMGEDAGAMLGVIRSQLNSMGEQVKMDEFEPQLEAVFGADYAPPACVKGPRP